MTIPHIRAQSHFIASQQLVPIPKSLWTRIAGYAGIGSTDGVWAVFGTHEEVREICAQPQFRKSNRKRLCMPVRGERYGAAWRDVIYRFPASRRCFARLRFTFPVSFINTSEY